MNYTPAATSEAVRFMFITVVNQKGGVGKTTLAVHLAIWLRERGLRVAVIDADGQAASTRWIGAAEPQITVVTEANADAIIEQGSHLRQTHDAIVGDGPANLAEATRALLLVRGVPSGMRSSHVRIDDSPYRCWPC